MKGGGVDVHPSSPLSLFFEFCRGILSFFCFVVVALSLAFI